METIGTTKHIATPSVQIAIDIKNEITRKNKFIEDHNVYQQDELNYDPKWRKKLLHWKKSI